VAALATIVAALVVSGWPDLSTLSVRLVIASAILFAFPTAVAADKSASWVMDQGGRS
jgi:hypothetical protein